MTNRIIKVKQADEDTFRLTFVINNICTNACSYCPKNLHEGTNHNYEWENAKRFFNLLFQKYPKVWCSVAGGEPSLSPFLPELAKMFYDNKSFIGITSNAAKSVRYWKEYSPYFNYICFSWHPEYVDKDFNEKVFAAAEHTLVTVRVMMHPSYWEESLKKYNEILAHGRTNVEAVRIFDWEGESDKSIPKSYTSEHLKWFEEADRFQKPKLIKYHGNQNFEASDYYLDNGKIIKGRNSVLFINEGMTNFYDYNCKIGLNSLYIDFNGFVSRGNCMEGGFIGHINEPEGIIWPQNTIICKSTLCKCATDVEITKWESGIDE
jgi:organic radical activating enzyme